MIKTLEERIKSFIETKNQIQKLSEEGEDFDYSIPMEMMETGADIIQQLQAENQALKKVIEMAKRNIEAISKDNAGDFSNYIKEELIKHIKNEKWFCDGLIKDINKELGLQND